MKSAATIFLALSLSASNAFAQSTGEAILPATPAAAGSNIGLVTYPSFQCTKPQLEIQAPKEAQKGTFNPYVGVAGPVTGVNDESYNAQVKKYNASANTYNAQMATYNSCAQTYTANANADIHRIRSKLEAAIKGSAPPPSETQAPVGTNIGLTDYPAAACVRPSNIDENLNPGAVPPLDATVAEVDAYNLRVTRYNEALKKHNTETANYNSCLPTYVANANADIQRIQTMLDAAVASAKSANIKTVTVPELKNTEAPGKSFVDSYAAPGVQINRVP